MEFLCRTPELSLTFWTPSPCPTSLPALASSLPDSVAASPPSCGQSGAPGRPDAWRQPLEEINVSEASTHPDLSHLPTQPHRNQGPSGKHSHGLLGLLLGISHLLLTELLCHLGLPLNLTEALAAHLLGPEAFLGTQLGRESCDGGLANHNVPCSLPATLAHPHGSFLKSRVKNRSPVSMVERENRGSARAGLR